jgi:hypothetical protein
VLLLVAMPCIAAVSPFGAQRPVNRGSMAAFRVDGTSAIHGDHDRSRISRSMWNRSGARSV